MLSAIFDAFHSKYFISIYTPSAFLGLTYKLF